MALGDGVTWDETLPDNDTTIATGDDHQRHIKVAVRSRMALEHQWPSSQAATASGGRHTYLTLQATTAPSYLIAGTQKGAISVATSGTGWEVFVCTVSSATTAGLDIQVTNLGGLNAGAMRIASQTKGDILYSTGTAGFVRLACGTTGALLHCVSDTAVGYIPASSFMATIVAVGAVTSGAISAAELAANSVTTAAIAANAVVSAKVASAAITAGHVTSIFGAWDAASYSKNSNYQAATDGFVLAYYNAGAGRIQGFTDADSTPSTEVSRHEDLGDDAGDSYGSVMFPVRKGHYWNVTSTATVTVLWMPVGV